MAGRCPPDDASPGRFPFKPNPTGPSSDGGGARNFHPDTTRSDRDLREPPRGPRALIDTPRTPVSGHGAGRGTFAGPSSRNRGYASGRGDYRDRPYRGPPRGRDEHSVRGAPSDRDRNDRTSEWEHHRRPSGPPRTPRDVELWSRDGDEEPTRRRSGGARSVTSSFSDGSNPPAGPRGRDHGPWHAHERGREPYLGHRERHGDTGPRTYDGHRAHSRPPRPQEDDVRKDRDRRGGRRRTEAYLDRERHLHPYRKRPWSGEHDPRDPQTTSHGESGHGANAHAFRPTSGQLRRSSIPSASETVGDRPTSMATSSASILEGRRDRGLLGDVVVRPGREPSSHPADGRPWSPPTLADHPASHPSPSVAGPSFDARRGSPSSSEIPRSSTATRTKPPATYPAGHNVWTERGRDREGPLVWQERRDSRPSPSTAETTDSISTYRFDHPSISQGPALGHTDSSGPARSPSELPNRTFQHPASSNTWSPIPTGPRAERAIDRGGRSKNQWVRPGMSYPARRASSSSPGHGVASRDRLIPQRGPYPAVGREDDGGHGLSLELEAPGPLDPVWTTPEKMVASASTVRSAGAGDEDPHDVDDVKMVDAPLQDGSLNEELITSLVAAPDDLDRDENRGAFEVEVHDRIDQVKKDVIQDRTREEEDDDDDDSIRDDDVGTHETRELIQHLRDTSLTERRGRIDPAVEQKLDEEHARSTHLDRRDLEGRDATGDEVGVEEGQGSAINLRHSPAPLEDHLNGDHRDQHTVEQGLVVSVEDSNQHASGNLPTITQPQVRRSEQESTHHSRLHIPVDPPLTNHLSHLREVPESQLPVSSTGEVPTSSSFGPDFIRQASIEVVSTRSLPPVNHDEATERSIGRRRETPPVDSLPYLQPRVVIFYDESEFYEKTRREFSDDKAILAEELTGQFQGEMATNEDIRREYGERLREWRIEARRLDEEIAADAERRDSEAQTQSAQAGVPTVITAASANLSTPVEGRRSGRFSTEYDLQRAILASEQTAADEAAQAALPFRRESRVIPARIPPMESEGAKTPLDLEIANHRLTFRGDQRSHRFEVQLNPFTEAEAQIFTEAFNRHHKEWHKIAAALPGRTFKDCIYHHYTIKPPRKNTTRSRRKKARAPKATQTVPTPSTQTTNHGANALISQLNAPHEPESADEVEREPTPAVTETGRPRRAAAPVFGEPAGAAQTNDTPPERGGRRGRGGTARERGGRRGGRNQALAAAATIPSLVRSDRSRGRTSASRDESTPAAEEDEAMPDMDLTQTVASSSAKDSGDDVPMSGTEDHLAPPAPIALLATGASKAPRSQTRTGAQVSGYWTVTENHDFPRLLDHFGTEWHAISDHMKTKTHNMVRNHYRKELEAGRSDWKERAEMADERIKRGEFMGPPPAPSQPRRRQEAARPSVPRPLAPSTMEPSDVVDGTPSVVHQPTSLALPSKRRRASTIARQSEDRAAESRSVLGGGPFVEPARGPRAGYFTTGRPADPGMSYPVPDRSPWVTDPRSTTGPSMMHTINAAASIPVLGGGLASPGAWTPGPVDPPRPRSRRRRESPRPERDGDGDDEDEYDEPPLESIMDLAARSNWLSQRPDVTRATGHTVNPPPARGCVPSTMPCLVEPAARTPESDPRLPQRGPSSGGNQRSTPPLARPGTTLAVSAPRATRKTSNIMSLLNAPETTADDNDLTAWRPLEAPPTNSTEQQHVGTSNCGRRYDHSSSMAAPHPAVTSTPVPPNVPLTLASASAQVRASNNRPSQRAMSMPRSIHGLLSGPTTYPPAPSSSAHSSSYPNVLNPTHPSPAPYPPSQMMGHGFPAANAQHTQDHAAALHPYYQQQSPHQQQGNPSANTTVPGWPSGGGVGHAPSHPSPTSFPPAHHNNRHQPSPRSRGITRGSRRAH